MTENTQNVEADLQERLQNFQKEMSALLGKYELGIAALPKINPNGTVGADPVIVSTRQKVVEEAKVDEPFGEPTPEAITE